MFLSFLKRERFPVFVPGRLFVGLRLFDGQESSETVMKRPVTSADLKLSQNHVHGSKTKDLHCNLARKKSYKVFYFRRTFSRVL